MKNKIIDILFGLAFFVMILLPLVFSDKEGGKVASDENRILAMAPSSFALHEGLTTEIENWINDNAGGRSIAKQFNNFLTYGILNEFRSESAIVMNDWYYALDSEDLILNNITHRDVMTDEESKVFVSRLEDINNFFNDNGIRFCAITFPYKVDIYSENLEGYLTQVVPNSEISLMGTLAELHPELNFTVVDSELKDAAAAGKLVCYRSYDGSHWNAQGILIGYKALMNQIQAVMPEYSIRILDDLDFNVEVIERTNTVLDQKFQEEDVSYSLKAPTAYNNQEWFTQINYTANDPWRSARCYETGDATKPNILIVGDSYIWMQMFPWIAESFNKSVFVHQFDEDNIQRLVDRMHPDIVVFAGLTTTIEDLVHYSALTTEKTTWNRMFF